jgi:ribosome-associated protein
MTALQELGKRISELPAERLKSLSLPHELEEAVLRVRTFRSREARRRQVQYIGALMRRVDSEPIRQAYQDLFQMEGREIRAFQEIERWRDELLRGNDAILDEIAARYPEMDRGSCLSLVQGARREQSTGKKKHARALFRYLRQLGGHVDRRSED